jgi:magnesium transporter
VSVDGALLAAFVAARPGVVARRLEAAPAEAGAALLSSLTPEAAAALMPHLAPPHAAAVVAAMAADDVAVVLAHVANDTVTSLLRRLDAAVSAPILSALPADRSAQIQAQLAHPEHSAGAIMDPLVVAVPADATAGEARRIVEAHAAHLYYYVYVVDAAGRLAGVFDLAELIRAADAEPVRRLMREHVVWLSADAPLATVIAHPAWRDFDALPVVGAERVFMGVLRHRRVRQLAAAEPRGGDDRAVRTVMALGEIYWLGLCGLIEGFATTAGAPAPAGGSTS